MLDWFGECFHREIPLEQRVGVRRRMGERKIAWKRYLISVVAGKKAFCSLYFQVDSAGIADLCLKENSRMEWNMEKVCQIAIKEENKQLVLVMFLVQ